MRLQKESYSLRRFINIARFMSKQILGRGPSAESGVPNLYFTLVLVTKYYIIGVILRLPYAHTDIIFC